MTFEAPRTSASDLRRGWCPTATEPMAAADGLLLRVRPLAGRLESMALRRLADICRRYGNGAVVLTRRGKLELRGISDGPVAVSALVESGLVPVEDAGLPDRIISPATDLDPAAISDVRPVLAALDDALRHWGCADTLPAKCAVVLDGGGRAHVGGTAADLRFDAIPGTAGGYRVALGGTFATASPIGRCTDANVPAVAVGLLDCFRRLRGDRTGEIRRVRQALAAWGTAPFREAVGHLVDSGGDPGERPADAVIGHHPGAWYGAAFAFGRLDADTLQRLADVAEHHGDGDLRILPTRAVLLSRARRSAGATLRSAGAIEEPSDPHLRAETCSGCGGCERGTTATLTDARTLVASAPTLLAAGSGAVLHVSGCAKGCAHPGPTAVTLTGRAGRYDLSIGDAAGSDPLWRDLDVRAAASRLTALERVFLGQRSGDEAPAATLGRLDPDWLRNCIEEEVAGA